MPARSLWGSSPRLAVPGSDRQVRKRRAQEPGGEGCTFPPRSPLQASLGDETAERCDFVTHPRGRGPRDNKSFAGVWAKTGGDTEPGNAARSVRSRRQALPASPRHLAARLGSARLRSAQLGSTRLRSRSSRPAPHALAPPRLGSGAASQRPTLTRLEPREDARGRQAGRRTAGDERPIQSAQL